MFETLLEIAETGKIKVRHIPTLLIWLIVLPFILIFLLIERIGDINIFNLKKLKRGKKK